MTPLEANTILALAGQYDGRKPDADAAVAWAAALTGLRLDDCLTAVRTHYIGSTDWLMPAVVRRRVNTIRNDRIERGLPLLVPPRELDDIEDEDAHTVAYRSWLATARDDLANGRDPRTRTQERTAMPADVRAQLDAALRPADVPAEEGD